MSDVDGRSNARFGPSPRVAESIAADLRKRILRTEADNQPLPRQEDLIQQYGVSGPSLREALRILEAEGLITVRRGKFGGAYVHKPNWSSAAYAFALSLQGQGATLAELAQSLLVIEPMAAAACASRDDRDAAILPALRDNLAKAEKHIGDGATYSRVAREFHDILVAGLENQAMQLLTRSLVAIWSVQEQIWADTVSAASEYPDVEHQRESHRTHVMIVRLIEEGDGDRVSKLSTAHVQAAQEVVLERFGDEFVDASSLAAVQAFKNLSRVTHWPQLRE